MAGRAQAAASLRARHASTAMSDMYRIRYRETRSGASVRGQEPIEQLIHYAMDVTAERVCLSIGINSASKVCSVDFYLR